MPTQIKDYVFSSLKIDLRFWYIIFSVNSAHSLQLNCKVFFIQFNLVSVERTGRFDREMMFISDHFRKRDSEDTDWDRSWGIYSGIRLVKLRKSMEKLMMAVSRSRTHLLSHCIFEVRNVTDWSTGLNINSSSFNLWLIIRCQ